jgi:hypothetical protein
MFISVSTLLATAIFLRPGQCQHQTLQVPSIPKNSSPIPNDIQSMSIEFAFFPDYSGNKSHPNNFSKGLSHNINSITGVSPEVRVGGTSQNAILFTSQRFGHLTEREL